MRTIHEIDNETPLGDKQELFMVYLSEIISYAISQGYTVRGGDLFRDPSVFGYFGEKKAYGSPFSNHKLKLAIDLLLFKEKKYLTKSEDYKPIGDYWKTLHPLCCWGGDFKHSDGNHFSIMHDGNK